MMGRERSRRETSWSRWLSVIALTVASAHCNTPTQTNDVIDASAVDGSDSNVSEASSDGSAEASSDAGADASLPREGCNPLAVTGECLLPYPSNALTRADTMSPTGLRLALPNGAVQVPPGRTAIEVSAYNRADGFPTSAPILVHLGVDIAPQFLVPQTNLSASLETTQSIALFDEETGDRVPFLSEMDANRDRTTQPRFALFIRPMRPLRFGKRHIAVLLRSLRTTENVEPPTSPGFVALRDNMPSPDPRIEALRPRYEEIFTFLASKGIARQNVLLAWDYTTASRDYVLGPILEMRRKVFELADNNTGFAFNIERVETPAGSASTARIVYGTFTPPNYLDTMDNLAFDAQGKPVLQTATRSYNFTMVIPKVAETATAPLPLVVLGHGIFGNGRDYLTGSLGNTVQPLAQQMGGVVVATDWIGLSSGDFDLILQQVVPNINRINIVTDRLVQSLANNLTLIELSLGALQADARVNFGRPLLDRNKVYYWGVSLGGIQGSSFVSLSRHISRAVMAVPGSSWSNMLPRSSVYKEIKRFVDTTYPDPLVQAEFVTLMQARFDFSDPINLSTLMFRDPLPEAPADRKVILQEAVGDCQVPNLVTGMLGRAMGVSQINPTPNATFGLTPVTAPIASTVRGVNTQFELPTELMSYRPPDTNVVPSMDNQTHSRQPVTPSALAQVSALFTQGLITMPCTGTCNPD